MVFSCNFAVAPWPGGEGRILSLAPLCIYLLSGMPCLAIWSLCGHKDLALCEAIMMLVWPWVISDGNNGTHYGQCLHLALKKHIHMKDCCSFSVVLGTCVCIDLGKGFYCNRVIHVWRLFFLVFVDPWRFLWFHFIIFPLL